MDSQRPGLAQTAADGRSSDTERHITPPMSYNRGITAQVRIDAICPECQQPMYCDETTVECYTSVCPSLGIQYRIPTIRLDRA